MKRFVIHIILSTLACTFLLPWYFMIALAWVAGLNNDAKPLKIFSVGLGTASIVWITLVVGMDLLYAKKVAVMVGELLGNIPPVAVYTMTGLLIGILAGFSALSGNYFRNKIVT